MKKLLLTGAAAATAFASAHALTMVDTDITANTTWTAANSPYVLDGETFVKNGATLTILPGTVVRGQPGTDTTNPGSLLITRNGKINASGLKDNPIIFTTATIDKVDNSTGNPGADGIPDGDGSGDLARFDDQTDSVSDFYDADPANTPLGPLAAGPIPGASGEGLDANTELWGGLLILGNAPTNLGTSTGGSTSIGKAESLEGFIEGLTNQEDTAYGGLFANDNSGVLEFVSVRHGGKVIGEANEINGITLAGVGFGTKIENCEVYMTWDDGFEWFGGTVNGKNLAVTFAGDDQYDGDQGWIGQVQYAFAVLPYFEMGSKSGDKLFEFDGQDGSTAPDSNLTADGDVVPYPSYAFANFTAVGPLGATGNIITDSSGSIDMKAGFSGDLYNGFIVNTNANLVLPNTPEPVSIDTVFLKNAVDNSGALPANFTVANITDQGATGNGLVGEDAAVAGGLDPRPVAGLGVQSNIVLPQPFETTAFPGAFNPDANQELWTTGWTALSLRGILVD